MGWWTRFVRAIVIRNSRHTLSVVEKTHGPDHHELATILNNLAGMLHANGEHTAAEPLYRRALSIDEKTFGPDHPNVARSLNNLAGLLKAKGEYAGAEPLYRRALAIDEKALGPDHASTKTIRQSLESLNRR
jgi:tetratricopeptide (TPR) repeat protein